MYRINDTEINLTLIGVMIPISAGGDIGIRVSLQYQDIIKCKQWRRFPLQYVYRSVRRIMYVILVGRGAAAEFMRLRQIFGAVSSDGRWQREDCRLFAWGTSMVIFELSKMR